MKTKRWLYVLPIMVICLVLIFDSSDFTGKDGFYQSLASADPSVQALNNENKLYAPVHNEQTQQVDKTADQKQTNNQQESRRLDVPLIHQMPELPRGCEVTSLAMLLQYAGVDVGKMELARNIPKLPFKDASGLHGNMNKGFVGDMYSFDNPGMGVYADAVFKLGSKYLPTQLVNLTGGSMDDIYAAIDKGSPVWVITNAAHAKLPQDSFLTWHTDEGSMKVTYREHSVVVNGYDNNFVYINDPLDRVRKVRKQDFEQAWIQMGRQAISIGPELIAGL
ncbi:C39 family peptidase [Paenibacillus sp. N1-5-1-14]|uniref:C39 family peptidase n=1 Tax=Paenibacillus radicibacter TaxID=2972488 RepID=UPI002159854B|nr:C39 family peptidase [Paenibacillus radicibacter]MCR8642725.1 C39 family peptidase [Paenibacillus radicibacter]